MTDRTAARRIEARLGPADRNHRATSADGTTIAGAVYGDGPPLVFVHGAMDDGTLQWKPVVPYLAGRFGCHVISMRNRGASGHSVDSSPPRLIEDVAAYASSVGEAVGLVGLSVGASWVLGAARRLADVTGVVAHEPMVVDVMPEEILARFGDVVVRQSEEAERGRLTAAVRIFAEFVGNDDEVCALDADGAFETMADNVPADLAFVRQSMEHQGPSLTDASELARIAAPVLLLQGARTAEDVRSWNRAGVLHVAEHVPGATVHEVAEVGHLAPMVAPEQIANEVDRFFADAHAAPG